VPLRAGHASTGYGGPYGLSGEASMLVHAAHEAEHRFLPAGSRSGLRKIVRSCETNPAGAAWSGAQRIARCMGRR
jgi:hypothetical protein